MLKEANFRCSHCGHNFVYEDRLLKHRCKQMLRKEEFQTPLGQAAWQHFQTWMRSNHKLIPAAKAFLHSKFYGAFMRFAKFCKDTRIPDPELYIRFMIKLDIPPSMFTNNQIYAAFIEEMDKNVPAVKNAKITIETLFNTAEDMGCTVDEVFDKIDPNDLIQLLIQRKVSPWLLLRSPKFNKLYHSRMSKDQRMVLETIIIPKIWAQKLKNHPEDVEKIEQFVKALGL
jgi:hypothetical protein